MNTATKKQRYTFEEYLTLEEKAEFKSEYHNGEIYAMSGGTPVHSQVAGNIGAELRSALRDKNCISYTSDLKIRIETANRAVYPDASVFCGDLVYYEDRKDVVTNPILVIEVLSPSTADFDRKGKFILYAQLSTLQEYVLIDTEQPYVEIFKRQPNGKWLLSTYTKLTDIVEFESIDITVPMSEIYLKVQFEKDTTK